MKFLKRVQGLEAAAATAAAPECTYGICWSDGHTRVDASALQPGAAVAMDMWIDGYSLEVPLVAIVERITADPDDLGWIYDGKAGTYRGTDAEPIGRMVELEGDKFVYCLRDDVKDGRECWVDGTMDPEEPSGQRVD